MTRPADAGIELPEICNRKNAATKHKPGEGFINQSCMSSSIEHQTISSPVPAESSQQEAQPPATIGLARDFYALERTWLAYNRTANALASHAVIVSQLFSLHEGHKAIGRVCAIVMISGGIILELIGIVRYFVQSRGLLEADASTGRNGKAVLATLFVLPIAAIVAFVCCGLFVLVLVVA